MQTIERSGFMFDHGPSDLRARLRDLMAQHLPPRWMGPFTKDPADLAISVEFCQTLAEHGLLVPEWPARYGGRDADLASGIVVREEMWANCEPRGPQYYGPNWIGPSITQYGTDAQRQKFLPQIASGRAIWCQGFSEPEAGSDLAAIKTRAVRDGDGYVITGQKIWTSWALWAEWCYLLARVEDPTGGPSGITVFLIPMDRDGVTVRGIDGLPGPHHLNELFLDAVCADGSEVLGTVGGGWRVIRDALANERVGIARYARADRALKLIDSDSSIADAAAAKKRILVAKIHNRIARLLCREALYVQRDGDHDDFTVSAARLATTRSDQEVADVIADVLGDRLLDDRYSDSAPENGFFEFVWRYSRAATIASGTTEVLQLLLSRRLFRGDEIGVAQESADMVHAVERLCVNNGGVDFVRKARQDSSVRKELANQLSRLIEGLDPRDGFEAGVQAAEISRRLGRFVSPLPVEAILMSRGNGVPLGLTSESLRIEHSDLFDDWCLVHCDQSLSTARFDSSLLGTRLGSFVSVHAASERTDGGRADDAEFALLHVLTAWYILGALEKALEMSVVYAQQREQFGAPIAVNQGVAFPLADASALLQGVHKLAEYSLWRIYAHPEVAVGDALALRWATLESAQRVLAICQQVHGAIGLCDEHDMSVVVTGLQPRLRIPSGLSDTLDAAYEATTRLGFDTIYTPAPASS